MDTVKLLRPKAAAQLLGVDRSTLYRWANQGKLPKPIQLSTRASVWRQEDLLAFVERCGGSAASAA